MTTTHPPTHVLEEAQQIRAVVDGIDRAVDAKDWAGCRALFTETIDADFTSLAGGEPGQMAADDLIGAWRTILHEAKRSHHIRTHHEIDLVGDTATVRSKAYIINIMARDRGSDEWEVWANFVHEVTRDGDGWRCSGMSISVVHSRGNELVREHVA